METEHTHTTTLFCVCLRMCKYGFGCAFIQFFFDSFQAHTAHKNITILCVHIVLMLLTSFNNNDNKTLNYIISRVINYSDFYANLFAFSDCGIKQ